MTNRRSFLKRMVSLPVIAPLLVLLGCGKDKEPEVEPNRYSPRYIGYVFTSKTRGIDAKPCYRDEKGFYVWRPKRTIPKEYFVNKYNPTIYSGCNTDVTTMEKVYI